MEFKSEYYTSWEDYLKENEVAEDVQDVVKNATQGYEEMVFDFTMWLTM